MSDPAIVLAAFGVARHRALPGILNIVERFRAAFPGSTVKLAFTSNQIRRIWRRRAEDAAWLQDHPGVPPEVLEVPTPLAAIASLQEEGRMNILVQSLHVYAGEEYADLKSLVAGLNSITTIKPRWRLFDRLALGRPALGEPGPEHPYQEDLERAARALGKDAEQALASGSALVYAGHGNHLFSTGVYLELELVMRRMFPGLQVFIGMVEGSMGLDYISQRLAGSMMHRVLLKPLMVVAGEHAQNDIFGEQDSWRTALAGLGYGVDCGAQGLGENDAWADLYVENARQAWEG